ncbi:hypothetical protein N0B31_01665 [Salinirubellus salinus]|uniref:Uncharacterized protein n=1 Tax=Salinirubellus salinus TaxID=1364945 RepID=A0A9E7R4D0_9EURY|nr:hypothetical protein [Salinirubellus salinus]UWM54999.1 hypothetical protein N0B31_01665 [Salinirubellus salinus]
MDHEVIEVTLQVTVDSGYPRENAPLEHEIRAFADRIGRLSSVRDIEATAAHPVDLSREAPRPESPGVN